MKKDRISNNGLASVRYRLGITQLEMAIKLETSVSTIKLVETGRRSLPVNQLLKLAQMEIELHAKGIRGSGVDAGITESGQKL